jgi:hypothetical protein
MGYTNAMGYTKRDWENKERIPEGELSDYPRFDAENMNRIEKGIDDLYQHPEEVIEPEYEEAASLETLVSGEKLGTLLGKVKKAITHLISHISSEILHNRAEDGGAAIGHDTKTSSGVAVGHNAKTIFNDTPKSFELNNETEYTK